MWNFKEFVDYVRELYRTPEGVIPLHEPRFRGNEKKYLIDCIDSTFVSSAGAYIDRFEQMVAEFTGSEYAVAAMNGTAALHIALLLSGVKRDDEVITQPLTFIATANAISYTGAKPLFIDIDRDTMGLSPGKLRDFLTRSTRRRVNPETGKKETFNKRTGRRIGAVLPMHTFGFPARIEGIREICDEYGIFMIEDAAESLGSYYKGKHTGTFGKFGILSFNGNKTITSGGGGMILTGDREMALMAKHITTTAKVPHSWEYVHDMIGFNYRLTNLSAALGVAQMEQLPGFIENKRQLAEKYKAFFRDKDVNLVSEMKNTRANYWLNALILEDRTQRDEFLKYTNEQGILTRPVWKLMNQLPMYSGCQTEDISNAEWLADRVVNIPSSVI